MKKRLSIFICSILFIVIFICTLIYILNSQSTHEYYIFSDIDDFIQIEEDYSGEIEIVRYDSPQKDKYIKDLKYSEFYAAKYTCEEFEFEIFAYEFENIETSKKYFEVVADRNSERDENFLEWGGISKRELVVLDDERIYVVSTKKLKETKEFLSQIFLIKIF